jgi:hypothetical protein
MRAISLSHFDKRPSRLAALPLVAAFLLETWVWRRLVALARFVSTLLPWVRFRDAARRALARWPAIVAVALFGVPLFVSEFGSFLSVVMMATGHVFAGMALYLLMKTLGLVLVPIIFEITRERLLGLPWFAWGYAKFETMHAMASRFVAPYRQAAAEWTRATLASVWRALVAFVYGASRSAARARAAKAKTLASSARAVGARPASPSH